VPGTSEQQLQNLLTKVVCNDADLNAQRIEKMLTLSTEGDAVIILDDTGFPEHGRR